MESKFPLFLTSLRRLCRSPAVFTGLRNFSCQTQFPDPPCIKPHPHCHFVKDGCRAARHVISTKLPFDKNMLDLKRQRLEKLIEPPCCVLRSASCAPCSYVWPKRKKKKEEKTPFRSMWEPKCIPREQPFCKDLLPRFDEMYYQPSNKCRCFQRTWAECPPVKQRLKRVCCTNDIKPPEVQKRVRKRCPAADCELDFARMRKLCGTEENKKCIKMYWPCCKPVRCSLGCNDHQSFSNCKRLRAPRPSYSDSPLRQRTQRQKECPPPYPVGKCEMFALQNHREVYGIKGSYC